MKWLVVVGICLLASGCGPTQVVLKDPKTGKIVTCAADPWANWNVAAATQSCADAYKSQGYKVLSSY